MDINIIEDDMLRNIRSAFREQYPFLTLRFYLNPHAEGDPSPESERIWQDKPIEEVTMFHTGGRINIDPDRTVTEVEYDFFKVLGICVQVFRRSGLFWIETTKTDHWTLKQQNDEGEASCRFHTIELPGDFDLQDIN